MALLVALAAMLPVSQAPVSEVAVCVVAVPLVQVTVEPTVIWIGFGLKHHGGVPAHVTIWAGVFAALTASDPRSQPGTTMARAKKSRRIG